MKKNIAMKLKNIRRVLTGSRKQILFLFFLLINSSGVFSQKANSPFEGFKGEEVSIISTEMVPTSVLLWDTDLSEKEELADLNQNMGLFFKSLTENSLIKDWNQYLLPASGFPIDKMLLENGIDSIAPVYAIRNDQLLPGIFLLRSKFIFTGQVEKEWVFCFSLTNNRPQIIKLDGNIVNSDLTILIRSLSPYPFLNLTSLKKEHPLNNNCRIKELSNTVEITCLANKIRELSPAQIKALNIELGKYGK